MERMGRMLGLVLALLPMLARSGWDDAEGLERLSPVRVFAVEDEGLIAPTSPDESLSVVSSNLVWVQTSWRDASGRTFRSLDASPKPKQRLNPVAGRLGLKEDGMGRWHYRGAAGPELSFGLLPAGGLNLSTHAPIAGVRVQKGGMDQNKVLSEGAMGYSYSVGWLDYSPWSTGTGAVEYGVSAGQTAMRYGVWRDVTLEGQVQTAPSMHNVGVGGVYSMGDWGQVNAGTTQSRHDTTRGSRYDLGYSVQFGEWLDVAYRAEFSQPGYSDLSRYASGPLAESRVKGTLEAGVPLANWGKVSGSYSDVRTGNVVVQKVGIAHQLALRRNVNLKWQADRDWVSGDYGLTLKLSMPLNLLGD